MISVREILFRGKRADNGKWITSQTRLHSTETGFDYMVDADEDNNSEVTVESLENQYYIYGMPRYYKPIFYRVENVCEYTGLVDKNGVKIFEGDIVKCVFDDIGEQFAVVKYARHGFVLEPTDNWKFCDFEDCEVVTNIFDNPDLLKIPKGER